MKSLKVFPPFRYSTAGPVLVKAVREVFRATALPAPGTRAHARMKAKDKADREAMLRDNAHLMVPWSRAMVATAKAT